MTVRMRSLVAVLAAGVGLLAAPAQAEECAPWPGEPSPLPAVDDPAPARARWAQLRTAELIARATALEPGAPMHSYLFWRRALCLDRRNDVALAGTDRTRPLRIHRARVVRSAPAPNGDPWLALAQPVALGREEAAPRPVDNTALVAQRKVRVSRILTDLGRADAALGEARFEEAVAASARARQRIDALGAGSDLVAPRVRLEVIEATAHIALGANDEARSCLVRALQVDPRLELDPETTSPKVMRALEAARQSR